MFAAKVSSAPGNGIISLQREEWSACETLADNVRRTPNDRYELSGPPL